MESKRTKRSRSRMLAVLLILSMLVFPVAAFAEDTPGDASGAEPAVTVDESTDVTVDEPVPEDEAVDTVKGDGVAVPEEEGEKGDNAATVQSTKPSTYLWAVEIGQKEENYRDVEVTVPQKDALVRLGKADSIKITARMYYGTKVRQTRIHTKKFADLNAENAFEFKLPYFGKWKVTATFLKDGEAVQTISGIYLGVSAERYNIAAVTATTPALIYSLKMFDENSGVSVYDGKPVPSIIMMTRTKQYDWDKLPENAFADPLLTKAEAREATTYPQYRNTTIPAMQAYIKDLMEINPDSYFVFYLNDWQVRLSFAQLVFETNVPDGQYGLRFITDGAATYNLIRKAYNTSDGAAKHEQLIASYNKFKKDVRSGKTPGKTTEGYIYLDMGNLNNYVYAAVDSEPDTQWWVIRKSNDTFALEDASFQARLVGDSRITSNYINNLLATVQTQGRQDEFQALYKFDDSKFEATRAKGKKIMMILGTSKSGEESYPVFDYVRFTKIYYRGDYEYYYKGHPGWISEEDPERKAALESAGMQVLESSIAAELFSFYNPDIALSGYQSTTFQNVGSEADGGLYNITKAQAYSGAATGGYAANMDFFMSDLKNPQTPASSEVTALIPKPGNRNFLIEFNKSEEDTDIAIWDATTEIAYYFSKDGSGNYKQTKKVVCAQDYKLSATSYTYDGKVKKPTVTVKDGTGKTIASSNYTVTYASGRKDVGKYKVTIKMKGDYYGSRVTYFKINPKKTTLTSVTAASKAATVKWTKQAAKMSSSTITGYQIQFATNSTFTTDKKSVNVAGYSKVSKKVTGLKGGKKYYVRVRTYKTVSGTKYYSPWSATKTVTTKK